MNRKKLIIGILFGLGIVVASYWLEPLAQVIGIAFAIAGVGGLFLCALFDVRSPFKILPREGEMDWEIYLGLCLGGILTVGVSYYREQVIENLPLISAALIGLLIAIGLDFLQSKNQVIEIVASFTVIVVAVVGCMFFGWSPFVFVPMVVGVIIHIIT